MAGDPESGGTAVAGAPAGSFQLGFQMAPLTVEGGLDTSGDFGMGPHPVDRDPIYKLACENRESGNKFVQEGQHQQAIGRYSELIMQLRTLESEGDVKWTDESRLLVRQLRAAAYLNLSLCFIKTEQWTHASNTATRALQGDKDPPDPKENVLEPEKKAKALFRRATAQCEGFGNFEKARDDLKKALEYSPNDKAVEKMFKKCQLAVAKVAKQADKKMNGFFNKATKDGDGGLFDDSLRPSNITPKAPVSTEPIKMKDGLWVMPPNPEEAEAKKTSLESDEDVVDYEELSREIAELKESRPEAFEELREKVKDYIEMKVEDQEKGNRMPELVTVEEACPETTAEKKPEST